MRIKQMHPNNFGVPILESIFDLLKKEEKITLLEINKPNEEIILWIERSMIHYHPNNDDKIISGSKEEIAKEINHRHNKTIYFVNDLNEVLTKRNLKERKDTSFIAISSLPLITNIIFNTKNKKKFIKQENRTYIRNSFKDSPYLFYTNYIPFYSDSWINTLLSKMVGSNYSKSLQSILGSFYTDFRSSKALVLVGDKKISNELFIHNIINTIFNKNNCISLNNKTLDSLEDYEIIDMKLIYHINKIPKNRKKRQKLYTLVKNILSNKHCKGKVIFTIEKEDLFLKDFIGSIDTFFLNSLDQVLNKLKEKDIVNLIKDITGDINSFARHLSTLRKTEIIENENDKLLNLINNLESKKIKTINCITTSNNITLYDNIIDKFIPVSERFKHMLITGQTGSGKTEIAKTLLYNDIKRNDGVVILLEPHGDFGKQVAKLPIEKERLVYIDLNLDKKMSPSINLFYLNNKNEINIQDRVNVIISVIKSINNNERFSGAMEDTLYNILCILLRNDRNDFYEVLKFLNGEQELLQLGKNSHIIMEQEFFKHDFENIKSTRDALKFRIKKILNNPLLANLFNGIPTIELEKMMNIKGKVIIFRIKKSDMLDSYVYYAKFILSLIQTIALRRANIKEENRVKTYCYIDEFQTMITPTIEETLTESRKYALYMTLINQSVSQIKNLTLRDIILSNTNVKLIGKNSNKTLHAMNNTLNTKLEDIEKLSTGEFYLSVGAKDVIKVNNSDVLLDGKSDISSKKWNEIKSFQLNNYYRNINSLDISFSKDELNKKIDEFIYAIKSKKIDYFDNIKNNEVLYTELINNFNDDSNKASGYISRQDLYLYFNLIYSINYFKNNEELLKLLKKDSFFKVNIDNNKTRKGKKRFLIN